MPAQRRTPVPPHREEDPEVIARRRADALAALPRIGTQQITQRSQMVRRLEDIAMDLGDTVRERQAKNDPYWWHTQDMLDEILDLLEAARAGVADT